MFLHLLNIFIYIVSGNDSEPAEECENLPPPAECESAITLTDSWRNVNAGTEIVPSGGRNCDTRDMNNNYPERPWFRFAGDAGNMMLNYCPPSASCGTHVGMWTDEEMPSVVGEIKEVAVSGSYVGNCNFHSGSILVMRCSQDTSFDFIYQFNDDYTGCSYGFCGMTQS